MGAVEQGRGIEFRLLGPLDAVLDGCPLPLTGPRLRALLTVLLLHANRTVSRDRLIDDVWGEQPPASAINALQVHISHLRHALDPRGSGMLVRSGSGYLLRVARSQFDLYRFEDAWTEGRRNLRLGEFEPARALLAGALELWRGDPLAEFGDQRFAEADAHRLAEMRLAAVGDKIDCELALGLEHEVVGELHVLVRRYPLQERPLTQLMLALYRCGRQAEALEACAEARRRMMTEFGLTLGPFVQRLERSILQQDAALEATAGERSVVEPSASLLLVAATSAGTSALVELSAPMAPTRSQRELILARVIERGAELDAAAAVSSASEDLAQELRRLRRSHVAVRTAAFTSQTVATDLIRLAEEQSSRLILLDATGALADGRIGEPLASVLTGAPCDVGLVVARPGRRATARSGVLVPFAGGEHDWAALEVGCWLAQSVSAPMRLLGVGRGRGRPDASRSLAAASLAVQRVHRTVPQPVLVAAGARGLLDAATGARVLLMGLSERWRDDGLGPVRAAIAERAACPVILVRRGLRPSALAPAHAVSRFTWSLGDP